MISSEKEVLEIKDFYKSILDNIINGVWVTNADDIIYYTNKGMENIAGIPAKQIVGSQVLKDFPESTLKYFRPYYQKVKDTLKSVFYDAVPVITPSGMHSYQSGWLIPRIKEGKYDGLICTVDDVTERKEAEEKLKESEAQLREINVELDQRVEERTRELKESEEKYRNLVENAQEGIWALDENENTIFINQKICEMLGYTRSEMMGKNLHSFIPDSMKKLIDSNRSRRERGEKETYDLQLVKKDGIIIHTNVKAAPIMDENQNYKGSFAYITDITQRKIAEQELDASEIKYRTIFEEALNPILIVGENSKYIDVNKATCEFLESNKEEILGKVVWDYTPPLLLEEQKITHAPFYARRTLETEYLVNGKIKTLLLNVVPFEVAGKKNLYGIGQNITDRLKVEQKLKESEEKYRLLAKNINDVIWIMDLNLKTTYISPSVRAMFDYTVEEDMALPFTEKFTSESLKKIGVLIKKHITPKNIKDKNYNPVITMEVDQYHKDGSIIPCEVTVNPMRDKSGVAIGLVGITRNIAKRKEAEKKLKESEEKYRTLFENSPYAVGLINTKGVVIQGNSNIEKVFGYKKEEFIGQSFYKFHLFSKEHNAIVLKNLNKLIKGEIPEPQELQLHRKDGSIIWVSMQPSIVKLKNETLIQVITQDISKIKDAELKLKVSEKRYRLLFESSPSGIGIVDFEGNIYAMNHTMEKITGYTLEESKQLNVSSTYADPGEHRKVLGLLEESGRLRNYEVNLKRKDGTLYYAILNIEIEEMEGKKFLITNIQDITEIKRAEEKLKELNKLKSELLRRTSHELKTPLVSIKGFSDLLLEVHREQLDDYILNTIEEIKKGCVRLETLITDILKTSELESGTIKLNKTEENLSFLIRYCVNELKGLYKLRNHKVRANIPDNLMVTFEKEQIHQVISNLLSNSIKFTPPNGEIEINSKTVNNFIVISIKDNGIGFAEEEKDKIFKQFGKIERFGLGYDVISEGTGLGLYISKKIIELHGGDIWMETEGKNKGSTFYFSLPIKEKF